jgi:hypothetical protein
MGSLIVGEREHLGGHFDAERLGCLERGGNMSITTEFSTPFMGYLVTVLMNERAAAGYRAAI